MMYYYSKSRKQKIVHRECCHHYHRMKPENIGHFNTLAEAYAAGYRLCSNCDTLTRQYRKEEALLTEFSMNNGLSIHLGKRGLWIQSPRSSWRIIADENKNGTKLYHKNELHPGKKSNDLLSAFHDQKVSYPALHSYLVYILDHDYYRMLNPLHPTQKKAPPVKGTKRYRKEQKKQKRQARRESIRNVLSIIDALSGQQPVAVNQ